MALVANKLDDEAVVAKKLVEVALVEFKYVAKKFVVVACVPVAFKNVKFCRVLEPNRVNELGAIRLPTFKEE